MFKIRRPEIASSGRRAWRLWGCYRAPLLLAGAVLLDLEQTTLPGIAHLMVETMIISDQIRAEDRANVMRALLLKHR